MMDEIIDFLKLLSENNDREWFHANKERYLHVKALFESLVEKLIVRVNEFDDSIGTLSVGDCTWRIYRDVRFSSDKRPYKTYMGCYFAPEGKRGPFSGYYFQVGISDETGKAFGLLATGNYYTEPAVLKVLREDIEIDDAKELREAIAEAKGFTLDDEQKLKRVPRGYDVDKPYSEFLKYKNFCLIKTVDVRYLKSKNFIDKLGNDFATTKPFLHLINRAIDYVRSEPV